MGRLSEALRLTQRIFEHPTAFGIGIHLLLAFANPNLIRTTAVITPQHETANFERAATVFVNFYLGTKLH
jgi:hypothetical protein